MRVIQEASAMQVWAGKQMAQSVVVGLVPTMGYLHEGHLSLIRLAKARCDQVVVSLFVNPTQFGPNEDLDAYPRDAQRDRMLCEAEGVDVLFAPPRQEIYAGDHTVYVTEETLSLGLCGQSRPGHFRGVLTVVAKLFNLVRPQVAVFGEKDAQQLRVIRRMVRDLNFPIEIVGGPTVREADGVAMSSRNKNLSPEARKQAVVLSRSLHAVEEAVNSGVRSVSALREVVGREVAKAPLGELDYLELVDDESLAPVRKELKGKVLVAIAVKFPGARLIDNRVIEVNP
jgi:pantoate--beta-alanine ligase